MRIVVSREGDMVDLIAWRAYRHRNRTAEILLDANPGLAAYGPILPAGLVIKLPEVPQPAPIEIRLWD